MADSERWTIHRAWLPVSRTWGPWTLGEPQGAAERIEQVEVVPAAHAEVQLELTDQEAHDVHHALSTVVQLIDQVGTIPREAPLYGARPRLVTVAQRLDHERRHHGAVPNPNGPGDA